jgi:predicted transcriptional regulator
MGMELDEELVTDAHVLLHPIRFRIVQLLAQEPRHINGISKALGEERRLVSYHLITLEEFGFVESKYEISENPKSKGKAIRKYWVTDKVKDVIEGIKKKL